jgi:hypothetical protein
MHKFLEEKQIFPARLATPAFHVRNRMVGGRQEILSFQDVGKYELSVISYLHHSLIVYYY